MNLYIVATPIGNLQDITIRAIKVLTSVDVVLCEDTRKAGFLLEHIRKTYPLLIENTEKPKLLSYYDQNETERIPEVLSLLKQGKKIALISDAGTPGISDPGFKLIRECIKQGIRIEPIPGPSSVITALIASGLPTDRFMFVGYPPKKSGQRDNFFKELKSKNLETTIVMFEAPHRLIETLESLKSVFGDIEISLARELTKIHEEITKNKISYFSQTLKEKDVKGEFVILFSTKQ